MRKQQVKKEKISLVKNELGGPVEPELEAPDFENEENVEEASAEYAPK